IDFGQSDIQQYGERWGQRSVTFVHPVDLGGGFTSEGITNPTVVLPPFREFTNNFPESARARSSPRRDPAPGPGPGDGPPPAEPSTARTNETAEAGTNAVAASEHERRPREGEFRPRRPPWLRGMSESEYQSLLEKRAVHGLVLAMSVESLHAASNR